MGNSSTSLYADGRPLYDPSSAWSRTVRKHLATFTGATAALMPASHARSRQETVVVLRDPAARPHLEAAARQWDLDEADTVLLWPSKAKDPAAVLRARSEFVARAERRLTREIRKAMAPRALPPATGLALRAQLLSAAAALPAEALPKPRGLGRWLRGPNGRRLVAFVVGGHE